MNQVWQAVRRWGVMGLVVVLAACGGGGGDGGDCLLGCGEGPDTPQAADLSISLSASSLPNNGTDAVTATVTAVDDNRNALPGIPITVSVNNDAVATVSGSETSDTGTVTAEVRVGANKSNRVITVTAVSGTLRRTASFQVVGARITTTLVPAVVSPGEVGQIEFRLTDVTSNPMPAETIVVVGPDGVETRASTGSNGDYLYSYTAPQSSGTIEFIANAGGAQVSATVEVLLGTSSIPIVTDVVRSASILVSSSVVPVNVSGVLNRSEVRALFLGDSNAPIQNIRVRFDLAGDPASIGGSFTSGTGTVYSTVGGIATSAYIPGSRSSPPDGVVIRACWDYDDFAVGTCPRQVTTTLTVIQEPLSVTIGTNSEILIGESGLDYVKRYLVQVVDSAGQAAADVQVTAPVDLLSYFKGYWTAGEDRWSQTSLVECDNEDINRNGVNEIYSNGVVEDANGSLNVVPGRPALEPRKADVSVSFEGSSRTNSFGQVVLRLTYPQDIASWVRFNLIVTASGVAGSEGRANFSAILPVLADEVNDVDSDVPFRDSPYGRQTSGVIHVTSPEGKSANLCTNPN